MPSEIAAVSWNRLGTEVAEGAVPAGVDPLLRLDKETFHEISHQDFVRGVRALLSAVCLAFGGYCAD